MMIGQDDGKGREDNSDVEEELYNLIRGHTSMMITANAEDSEDSDGSGDSEEESDDDHQGEEEENDYEEESVEEDKSESAHEVIGSSVVPAEQSSSVEPEWGQANGPLLQDPNYAPTPWLPFEWGNALDGQGPERLLGGRFTRFDMRLPGRMIVAGPAVAETLAEAEKARRAAAQAQKI
jgi:hypothetical protein